jgi:hypothetical protein
MSGASTLVKGAALLMIAPAALLPMKAAAQQFAASRPDYSACEPLKGSNDAGAYARCMVGTLQAHTRQMQAEAVSEQALQRCIGYLQSQRAAGRTFGQVTRENVCTIARQMGMQNG